MEVCGTEEQGAVHKAFHTQSLLVGFNHCVSRVLWV